MDRKFGIKDFVLFALIVALIVSVWLAIAQYDRQWDEVQSLNDQMKTLVSEQSQTSNRVQRLRQLIEQGVTVNAGNGGTPTGSPDGYDPHAGVKKARDAADYKSGDWLIDAFPAKVAVLTPLISKDYYARLIEEQVFEPLLTVHPDTLEYVPQLATHWEVDDRSEAFAKYKAEAEKKFAAQADADAAVFKEQLDFLLSELDEKPAASSDAYKKIVADARQAWIDEQIDKDPDRKSALIVTFFLRKNLNFSDGHPLTAEDVVFTLDLMNDPKLDCPDIRNFYDNIERAEAVDDHTVKFYMKKPHYLAVSMAGGRVVLPKHFYSKYTAEQINENPGLMLGSGPFRMYSTDDWRPGKTIELLRNERYWGPPAAFEKFIWHEINNEVARQTQYINGELDLLLALPEQYESLRENENVMARSNAMEYDRIPSGYRYLGWNQDRNGPTMFADKRVRQAMTYLTPRQRICDEVLLGYAAPTAGPWGEDSPQSDPNVKPRKFDMAKAKALLAEAGWEDTDGDGVLDKDGKPFRFKLTYSTGSPTTDRIVLFLKDSYADAGIALDLDGIEWSVFSERLENRTFDAIFVGWGGGAIESDIRQMFHSSQIGGGADNYPSYANPELDTLIDAARTTLDYEKRMKLWNACHRILHEDQPYTFMFRSKRLVFMDKRIKNVSIHKTGLNDQHQWYVPGPLQRYK